MRPKIDLQATKTKCANETKNNTGKGRYVKKVEIKNSNNKYTHNQKNPRIDTLKSTNNKINDMHKETTRKYMHGANNNKLKKAIKSIAHKNICALPEWRKKYPDCIYSESKKSDQYNHIVIEAMGGSGDNDDEKADKIISKIAKTITIDKNNK